MFGVNYQQYSASSGTTDADKPFLAFEMVLVGKGDKKWVIEKGLGLFKTYLVQAFPLTSFTCFIIDFQT